MSRPTATAGTTTAVIIAGGEARRMGGREKGLLPLRGKPLFAHVLERLRPQVERVRINANRQLADYGAAGVPVFADDEQWPAGPLRGILTSFAHADTPWLLFVPCDTPALPADLLARLAAAAAREGLPVAVAHDGERQQSLCLLVHRDLQAALADFAARGGRAIHRWLATTPHAVADFADTPAAFINLNTPDELAHANDAT